MSRHRAIRNIHPSVVTTNGELEAWDDSGNVVVIDEALVKAEEDKLKAEYDAQEYARNRQTEYPDWGTQLNKIYDDGVTKWKAEMVDPVKAKWPKDNSGPV
jgi:hypothetical protein